MQPTQELQLKLSRRRVLTEGDSPEVPARICHPVALPEWAKQAAAAATGGLSWPSNEASPTKAVAQETPSSEKSPPSAEKRRVQVPVWALPAEAEARANPERFRLRMAEVERDAARRAKARFEAEAAAKNAELQNEIDRLKHSAESLREELAAARSEVSSEKLQTPSSETQDLVRALWRDREESVLEARAQSLVAERDRQTADIRLLEEQLRTSQASLASIHEQVKMLQCAESANSPNSPDTKAKVSKRRASKDLKSQDCAGRYVWCQTGLGDVTSAVATPQRCRAGTAVAQTPPLPSAHRVFRLDTSPDRQGSGMPPELPSPRRQSRGRNDLEFGYEWGLELSSRMSIERALHLARWATAALRKKASIGSTSLADAGSPFKPSNEESPATSLDSSDVLDAESEAGAEKATEEDPYAVPLAELQSALAVLRCAYNDHRCHQPQPEAPASEDLAIDPSILAAMQAKRKLLEAIEIEGDPSPVQAKMPADAKIEHQASADASTVNEADANVANEEGNASAAAEISSAAAGDEQPVVSLGATAEARLLLNMPLSTAFALRHLGSTTSSAQAHVWQKYAGKLQR